jgi:hypothetical protein
VLVSVLITGLAAFLVFMTGYVERKRRFLKEQQDPCDYVIFEAHPSHLPLLEADLGDHRWRLSETEPSASGGFLYRFEKASAHSALLSDVLDTSKSMKRTANRKADGHMPIKIKAQGVKRNHA